MLIEVEEPRNGCFFPSQPEEEMQPTPVFLPGKLHGQRGAWWAAVQGVAESQTRLAHMLPSQGMTNNARRLGQLRGSCSETGDGTQNPDRA